MSLKKIDLFVLRRALMLNEVRHFPKPQAVLGTMRQLLNDENAINDVMAHHDVREFIIPQHVIIDEIERRF